MGKLKLSEWAHIAEILGAVSIVVSLIYVGVQIDQNTDEIRAASVQSIVERDQQMTLAMATDPTLRTAISSILTGERPLNTEEAQAMRQALLALMRVLEDSWNKYQLGYLSDEFMRSRTRILTYLLQRSPQLDEVYQQQKAIGIYPADFIAWFDMERSKFIPDEVDADL